MLSNCCQRFEKPSNETLLWVAFASFLGFTLVQSIVAFIAESQAMMGDSAAMFVDCLTYGFNLYAEREKKEAEMREEESKYGIERSDSGDEDERVILEKHLNLRRRHLHLELFPPVISVSILIVVTVLVLKSSIESLILDASRSQDEQGEPNLEIMMAFCIINVFVDGMNVFCFARAKHLAGYNTESEGNQTDYNTVEGRLSLSASEEDDDDDDVEDTRVNLNMCSAYTHVFADSLRTIAVLVTTITAELVDGLTPEVADSSAAVFVSIVILLSLLPLVKGIFKTACELRTLSRQMESIGCQQQLVDFVGEEDDAGGVEIT